MRRISVFAVAAPALIVAMILLLSCRGQEESASGSLTIAQARQIADVYIRARNTPDLTLLDQIYSPEVVVHDPVSPRDICGLDELKAMYLRSHTGFSDFKMDIGDIYVGDSKAVYIFTLTATHTGLIEGVTPTGNQVRATGAAVDSIADGKIVEEWVYYNPMDILGPMGYTLTPPAGESAKP